MMMTKMNYQQAKAWIITEDSFDVDLLGKTESIMCLGNGYLGIRSTSEEIYIGEKRNCFVAGTFNKSDASEVTELPNAADVIWLEMKFGDERFSLTQGQIVAYEKGLNLQTGELFRKIEWLSPQGYRFQLNFARFVSLNNLHVMGQKITIKPLDGDVKIQIQTGIDGTMTNSGAGHFAETQKRFYENRYMQYIQTTTQSQIVFSVDAAVAIKRDGEDLAVEAKIDMSRRKVFGHYEVMASQDSVITIEKISTIHTSRDIDYNADNVSDFQRETLANIKYLHQRGYQQLFAESCKAWERYWEYQIKIDSDNEMDQLAMRFAQYHLRVMTPFHDSRMNIGAKGLSGEGYKGHTFWDTEIFILPYFTFQFPEVAKNLVQYRYYGLDGARRKAAEGDYLGAQYPWEAAWILDGEVTPEWGDVDIVTGMAQIIWTGKLEQHITADVIYGLWEYYQSSGDEEFMKNYGYEMIFETAMFWCSRLEMGDDGYGHINNVIGPDEYKEHVDDNAFTNYMAYWNIAKAIEVYEAMESSDILLWQKFNKKLSLVKAYRFWQSSIKKLYLPKLRKDGVMPQDATYLSLKEIDLTKYKEQDYVLGIYKDYNAEQINDIQVSKQADVLILFLLLENYFTQSSKVASWHYYEPKTLHDSSLSLSTHCILANDIGKYDLAYDLFRKLADIDLGPYMKSSDAGIHAASLGGIWKSVIFGFGGVRNVDGELRIRPALPKGWNNLSFKILRKGLILYVIISREYVDITVEGHSDGTELIEICGEKYSLQQNISVKYS